MNINFEPYNNWILYAAILITLVVIVITLVKILKMFKCISTLKPNMDSIQKNAQLASIKVEAMQEKKKEDDQKNKYLKILLPIVLAVKQSYDNHDEYHGVKGYASAASNVLQNHRQEQDLLNRLKAKL